MVHSLLNEKSSLNVPAILKAEQEYHEAKALASKQRFVAGGGVFPTGVGSKSGPVDQPSTSTASGRKSQLLADIDKIRRDIQEVLSDDIDSIDKLPAALDKLNAVDSEVKQLRDEIQQFSKDVFSALSKLGTRLESLSVTATTAVSSAQKPAAQPSKVTPQAPAAEPQKADDDIDLFGSDDEEVDPEAEKQRQDRLSAYEQKKAKKPALIAKSMIILDVKPWDDETDVQEMERKVRSIEADGLVWGTSKFVEVAYGIKKLQITCVVEDEKISTDFLEEQITGFEELVQSIDIVAFNKI